MAGKTLFVGVLSDKTKIPAANRTVTVGDIGRKKAENKNNQFVFDDKKENIDDTYLLCFG